MITNRVMTVSVESWDRKLWGIQFKGAMEHRWSLLGASWMSQEAGAPRYIGEPTRVLSFSIREQARAFCDVMYAKYRDRNDCCGKWRFRPVRIRELVSPTAHST